MSNNNKTPYEVDKTIMTKDGRLYPAGVYITKKEFEELSERFSDRLVERGTKPFRVMADEELKEQLANLEKEIARREAQSKVKPTNEDSSSKDEAGKEDKKTKKQN